MRLWPTTTMLSRETLADTEWGGATVPAGTQVLIPNTFLHRDRDRHEWADRFAPERWLERRGGRRLVVQPLQPRAAGLPGTALALLLGKAVLADVLRAGAVELRLALARPGQAAARTCSTSSRSACGSTERAPAQRPAIRVSDRARIGPRSLVIADGEPRVDGGR